MRATGITGGSCVLGSRCPKIGKPVPYDADTSIGGRSAAFPETRWSILRAAGGQNEIAREALSSVIELYWKPVYKYARIRWKRSNEDAKDLVQAFFAALLEQDVVAKFDPAKGSFRSYIRACVDRFTLKQNESARRLKRGGPLPLPVDFECAERELASGLPSPEDVFLIEWRRQTFTLALDDLRQHCQRNGYDLQYRVFARYDLADTERPRYADLAAEFAIPITTVTNYLAWTRRELRRMVLARLAPVTSGAPELRSEMRVLLGRP
jgi:RNA polymerase sigma factor (sigma-70 family)